MEDIREFPHMLRVPNIGEHSNGSHVDMQSPDVMQSWFNLVEVADFHLEHTKVVYYAIKQLQFQIKSMLCVR